MTTIKVGDKFFSTPEAHLSCDMSRDTLYEVIRINDDGIHWRDNVGDLRWRKVDAFLNQYTLGAPTTGLYSGAEIKCVHKPNEATFRDTSIGSVYKLNYIDKYTIGWKDDKNDQVHASRDYADACFAIVAEADPVEPPAPKSELDVEIIQSLMRQRGVEVNDKESRAILSMLDSVARFKEVM